MKFSLTNVNLFLECFVLTCRNLTSQKKREGAGSGFVHLSFTVNLVKLDNGVFYCRLCISGPCIFGFPVFVFKLQLTLEAIMKLC